MTGFGGPRQGGAAAPIGHFSGCMLCGKPLVYEKEPRLRRCSVCGEEKLGDCACEDGHFVCDACHSAGLDAFFIPFLLRSTETCPQTLLEQVLALPQVHMHGPEHHAIVPCVLLTAFHNCGGGNDLKADLSLALKRGRQVPGGACGYWGVCGAAAGAGIYMSVLTGSAPLNGKVWGVPQELVSRCLAANAALGGPRCCKRTSRTAVHEAARFTAERLGVVMPEREIRCTFTKENRECIGRACPYFPAEGPEVIE